MGLTMYEAKVTVAIPTYNRSQLLTQAVRSVLVQDCQEFCIVVIDNASTDDTEGAVKALNDSRIRYVRNPTNIGQIGNFNRSLQENSTPYLTILLDDDLLLPGFIGESLRFLESHPTVGLSFTLARYIDHEGNPLHLADVELPPGVVNGLQYLDLCSIKRRGGCLSTVMMRVSALPQAGFFDSPHTKHTTDVNFYHRLARNSDIGFIPKELAQVRCHPGQVSETAWGPDRLGYDAEYIDIIAHLLTTPLAEQLEYRSRLARRLMSINRRQSQAFHKRVPNLYWTWNELSEMAQREIAALIAEGETLILVDQASLGPEVTRGRLVIPFLEHDGEYWGPPSDDDSAVREIERLRARGAAFIVFAWPALWWLDHYRELDRYLRANFPCVLHNDRMVVFRLT